MKPLSITFGLMGIAFMVLTIYGLFASEPIEAVFICMLFGCIGALLFLHTDRLSRSTN